MCMLTMTSNHSMSASNSSQLRNNGVMEVSLDSGFHFGHVRNLLCNNFETFPQYQLAVDGKTQKGTVESSETDTPAKSGQ